MQKELLESYIIEKLTFKEILEKVGLGPSYLYELFRKFGLKSYRKKKRDDLLIGLKFKNFMIIIIHRKQPKRNLIFVELL